MMRTWLWLPCAAALGACAQMGVETLPTQAQSNPVTNASNAGLPEAPSGYRWFRTGSEYVLAANLSGRILRSVPAPRNMYEPTDAFGLRGR